MDDTEYYALMRRQYSHTLGISKKNTVKNSSRRTTENHNQETPGSFSEWEKKYGHEDAEMFLERNTSDED